MSLRPPRFPVLVLALLPAACADDVIEAPFEETGDALSPRHPEMISSFPRGDLAVEPPATADDFPDLRVEVLAEGESGAEAIHFGEIGRFHVIGSLSGGKVFQNTYAADDPKPEVLRLLPPAVPEGLALGLDGCVVGERRLITVPSHLAFGEESHFAPGQSNAIPPHATLIYEVELVEPVTGLGIEILEPGDGPVLEYGQTASFEYVGVLAENGEQFDATSVHGQPFQTPVQPGNVIAGWALGLPGMKVGEKRRLWIPSELAYGETGPPSQGGTPSKIGPNADLVFDVTLVEIAP